MCFNKRASRRPRTAALMPSSFVACTRRVERRAKVKIMKLGIARHIVGITATMTNA
jgi:hypothetical protein